MEQVGVVVAEVAGREPAEHGADALQTGTGIDRRRGQAQERSGLFAALELHEHQVPDPPGVVTDLRGIGLALADPEVDPEHGTLRASVAHHPEVVFCRGPRRELPACR